MEFVRDYPTNGAIAIVGEREFENLLNLPAGVTVRGIYLSEMRRAIVLHLVGDCLPKLREGYEAEHVQVQCEWIHDGDGKYRTYLSLVLPCACCGGQGVVGDGGYVACPACATEAEGATA